MITAMPEPRISLALAFHNHQPVGNFGWVFEDVYRAAYRPMVDLLLRHPRVRCGLHYTGPLLHWIAAKHPEFLADVAALVDRGQVEILGGGLYEPVLASLPEADRVAQLILLADEVERRFGSRPRGAWLAERVWEPSLPTALADSGYAWTIVDDAHLRAAAIPDSEHWGTYSTDDQGRRITIFPTEQGLRYLIPFQPVEEVIAHLRAHATPDASRLGTMGDDGEKFGAWPTTYEHCWGSGQWMERFFGALEANAGWLTTIRPSDWTVEHPPVGRVYLPTGSYTEMTEWALPPADALAFERALEVARTENRPEARFLRGGFWRNFQTRYREINDLHKQMLRTSAKVAAMPDGPTRERAQDHLYQGQSNDCYWHGLFGGVYISHMRLATFEHLIAAEDLADATSLEAPGSAGSATTPSAPAGTPVGKPAGRIVDIDVDGVDEVLFEAPGQVVGIKLDGGGAIAEWDVRAVRHAMTAVLRRRPEASHERLVAAARSGRLAVDDPRTDPIVESGTVINAAAQVAVESIHEIVRAKEPGLADRLWYDEYERRSALVRILAPETTLEHLVRGTAIERVEVRDAPYDLIELGAGRLVARLTTVPGNDAAAQAMSVSKTFDLDGDRLMPRLQVSVHVENKSRQVLAGRLAIEWNLTLLGGGGNPAAFYEVHGNRTPHDEPGQHEAVGQIVSGNTDVGVLLTTTVEPPADAWWYPIDTISNSESGFERVYQGSSLVLSWPINLAPGGHRQVVVRQDLVAGPDRAVEEARAATTRDAARPRA